MKTFAVCQDTVYNARMLAAERPVDKKVMDKKAIAKMAIGASIILAAGAGLTYAMNGSVGGNAGGNVVTNSSAIIECDCEPYNASTLNRSFTNITNAINGTNATDPNITATTEELEIEPSLSDTALSIAYMALAVIIETTNAIIRPMPFLIPKDGIPFLVRATQYYYLHHEDGRIQAWSENYRGLYFDLDDPLLAKKFLPPLPPKNSYFWQGLTQELTLDSPD